MEKTSKASKKNNHAGALHVEGTKRMDGVLAGLSGGGGETMKHSADGRRALSEDANGNDGYNGGAAQSKLHRPPKRVVYNQDAIEWLNDEKNRVGFSSNMNGEEQGKNRGQDHGGKNVASSSTFPSGGSLKLSMMFRRADLRCHRKNGSGGPATRKVWSFSFKPTFARMACTGVWDIRTCFASRKALVLTTDVLPEVGDKSWKSAMGLNACIEIVKFLHKLGHTAVVNPFCGKGSDILAVANAFGMDAIGVEMHKKRARRARAVTAERLKGGRISISENKQGEGRFARKAQYDEGKKKGGSNLNS
eukprot:jgi/Bigna1/88585/estExt_fgenesh1_pg.C_340084